MDYGNVDSVPRSQLKSAHPLMLKSPVFAVRCGLKGVLCGEDTLPAGAQTFMDKLCGDAKVCERERGGRMEELS